MVEKFTKLIDLKSIITLLMVFALVFGYFKGQVSNEIFIPILIMVLTYYFNKKEKT